MSSDGRTKTGSLDSSYQEDGGEPYHRNKGDVDANVYLCRIVRMPFIPTKRKQNSRHCYGRLHTGGGQVSAVAEVKYIAWNSFTSWMDVDDDLQIATVVPDPCQFNERLTV